MSNFFKNGDHSSNDSNYDEPPTTTGTMPAVRYTENQWITELEHTVREKANHKLMKYSCERTEKEVSLVIDNIVSELSGLKERVGMIQEEEKRKEELLSKQYTERVSLNKEQDAFTRTFDDLVDIDIEEWSDEESHGVFNDLRSNIIAAFDKARQDLADTHAGAKQALTSDITKLNESVEPEPKEEEFFDAEEEKL